MSVGIALVTIVGLAAAIWALRGDTAKLAYSRRIRDHFAARGHEVLKVEPAGLDFNTSVLKRNLPIRKFRVVMKSIHDGEIVRVIGVDVTLGSDLTLYAYDGAGARHPMF